MKALRFSIVGVLFCLIGLPLLTSITLAAQGDKVYITEFMALNSTSYKDETGQTEDWIEIYNSETNTVNLGGWFLTDNTNNLRKWRFPAAEMPPLSYLTVFASGNDRTNAGAPFHTNFRLDGGGEYLALVRPDGLTVASQYAPRYPVQRPDVSYGIGMIPGPSVYLVNTNASARILIPSADIGSAWKDQGFDDSSWTASLANIGFDQGTNYDKVIATDLETQMAGLASSVYMRIPFQVDDPSQFQDMALNVVGDDGFVAYLNGSEVARLNAPGTVSWNSTATKNVDVGVTLEADFDTVTNKFTAIQKNVAPGPAILAGDSGSKGKFIRLMNDTINNQANGIAFDQVSDSAFPIVNAEFDFRVTSVGDPADGFAFMLIPTSIYGPSGPGIETPGGAEEPNFSGVFAIGFDLYPHATANDVSVHWNGTEILNYTIPRTTIEMVSGQFHHFRMYMQFDANGAQVTVEITPNGSTTPVTVINRLPVLGMKPFPCRVQYIGRTGGSDMSVDLDEIKVKFAQPSGLPEAVNFDLSRYIPALLQKGQNLLTFQAMNYQTTNSDFLLLPQLVARSVSIQSTSQLYLVKPTPNLINIGGEAQMAPAPEFTLPSGIYSTATVMLGLTSSVPGAVIHYTLNGVAPTEESPTYTGPLTVSNSVVMMAKVYAPNYYPSRPVSHNYTLLDSSVFSFSSGLPLVIVDTLGQAITPDMEPKPIGILTVIDAKKPSGRATLQSKPDFHGRIGLEGRGQTSWGFNKRPYNIEIRDDDNKGIKANLLDFPAGSDFALISLWNDKTLMNDFLAYQLYSEMGHYSVRHRYVEVFWNGNHTDRTDSTGKVNQNDYVGIYLLLEKIRIDKDRVDISEPQTGDPGDPITGGYIWKKDKDSPGDAGFYTTSGQYLKYHDPRPENLTAVQRKWLVDYLNEFEAALYGPNWRDPMLGYAKYIDVDSFVDQHWMVEYTKQIDGYRLSNYMHKDRNGKIKMAPIWDWNLSFGNANYLEGGLTNGWYYPLNDTTAHIWLRRLVSQPGDPEFNQKIVDRWGELRNGIFNITNMVARIDQLASYLNEAQARDFSRWNRISGYLWPNPDGNNLVATGTDGTTAVWDVNYSTLTSHAAMVAEMKKWLTGRFNWIDKQFLRAPTFSRYSGSTAAPLVMTKTPANAVLYYTLDGSDPRMALGAISPKALVYTNLFTPPAGSKIFARLFLTNAWSPPTVASFGDPIPSLAITEIMFNPAPSTDPLYSSSDYEYLTFRNTSSNAIDLTGMRLSGGVDFVFPQGPLTQVGTETTNAFEGAGTAYATSALGGGSGVSTSAGPSGNYLSFASVGGGAMRNRIAFDRTAQGNYDKMVADFDFRATNATAKPAFVSALSQDFSHPITNYAIVPATGTTIPAITSDGGVYSNFMRLCPAIGSLANAVYFDRGLTGTYQTVVINMDFRITPGARAGGAGRADGMGFALLNTALSGTTNAGATFSEEPNIAGALGVGIDIYSNSEVNNNHITLHWNNALVTTTPASPKLDLAAGVFHRIQVTYRFESESVYATVKIAPDIYGAGGLTEILFSDFRIANVAPFEGRMAIGARTGGENAQYDVDNVTMECYNGLVAPAAGISMVMLPTSAFGSTGTGSGLVQYTDKPNATNIFGLNFNISSYSQDNSISLHWNGQEKSSLLIPQSIFRMDNGVFNHIHFEAVRSPDGAVVTVTATPDALGVPSAPILLASNVLVADFFPQDLRVEFAGRSGGQDIGMAVDNVRVEFSKHLPNWLNPGEYAVLVNNQQAFQSRYGTGIRIMGSYLGNLNDGGEQLVLRGAYGEPILNFHYNDTWQSLADGLGFSLVLNTPNAPASTWDLPESWRLSSAAGGSPGREDATPSSVIRIVINEVLSHTPTGEVDVVELYNPYRSDADISFWYLTDDFNNPFKYRFPPGTVIQASKYLVVTEAIFNTPPGATNSFALKAEGESIYLFSGNGKGELTGYYHGFDFGSAEQGVTFGRHVISTGNDHFVAQISPTLGSQNSGPKISPVVISEVMYHPLDYADGSDNQDNEFIELLNTSSQPVNLFDAANPTFTWRLRDAVNYHFPTGVTLPTGGSLLVVSFNPALETAKRDAFRAQYGLSPATQLFGPYEGKLNNDGNSVELTRPGLPDPQTGQPDHFLVDKANYNDNSPWPIGADGTGYSLQRLACDQYGNDPTNWTAALPTPGAVFVAGTSITITANPTNQTVFRHGDAQFTVSATGPGNLRYQWKFNGAIIPGATNATLLVANAQLNQAGNYQVAVFGAKRSADSAPATLQVFEGVSILTQPVGTSVGTNANVTFAVTASGNGPVSFQWLYNGIEMAGATNNSLTLNNVKETQSGVYRVLVSDALGGVLSQPANLAVYIPAYFIQQPASLIATAGTTVSIFVVPGGTEPFSYRWRKNNSTYISNDVATATVVFTNIQLSAGGTYDCIIYNPGKPAGTLSTAKSSLTVVQPPADKMALIGSSVSLRAGVLGPNGYKMQWKFNGTNITGATTTNLALNNLNATMAGTYTFVVTNVGGVQYASFPCTLTVQTTPTLPVIIEQPQSQVATQSARVTFDIAAIGTDPLLYQWWFNETNAIAGGTNTTLTLTNVSAQQLGAYSVVVTNPAGAVTSSVATLAFDNQIADSDGDGLPDDWETAAGLNPNDPADADADADNDGMSNRNEYLAGTDPKDAGSRLALQLAPSNNNKPMLTFQAAADRAYSVEFRQLLGSGSWLSLTNIQAQPVQRNESVTDNNPNPINRFYRIRLVP